MDTNFYQNWDVRKPAVAGGKGVVASHHRTAAEVGAAVLAAGGNAIDAAVATSLAVSVVEPWMSGPGGGGYMMIYLAKENRVRCIACGMQAPKGLDPADYPIVGGKGAGDLFTWPAVKDDRNLLGYPSIAVPGLIAGLELALGSYGTRPWESLIAPAVELAERGLPVNWLTTLRVATAAADLRRFPASADVYLPNGLPPLPASTGQAVPHQKMGNYAAMFRRLAKAGPRDFYEGEIARQIAADMAAGGGPLALADLQGYRARDEAALARDYGGATVYAAPGMTAGPTLMATLERIEGRLPKGSAPGPEGCAVYARALAAAYEERFATMGDVSDARAPGSTTHLTVIDGEGNIVSLTQTLLSIFGSKVVLPQTGILMNNGIMWFDPRPGGPNALGGGKRPLSNMCPVVVGRDGAPWLGLGASGGRKIMPAVMQVASFMIDYAMDLEAAFHHPRIDVSGEGKAMVDARLPQAAVDAVAAHMPASHAELAVYPNNYAKPNGVLWQGTGKPTRGMADVMNPVSGVVGG